MSNERHRHVSYRPVAPVRRDDTGIPGESGESRNPVALGRHCDRQVCAGASAKAVVATRSADAPDWAIASGGTHRAIVSLAPPI
jgi:hypothetical protein